MDVDEAIKFLDDAIEVIDQGFASQSKTEIEFDAAKEGCNGLGIHMGRQQAWEVARQILGQLENEDTNEIGFYLVGSFRDTTESDR